MPQKMMPLTEATGSRLGHNHVSGACIRLGLDNGHDLGSQKSARGFGHDHAHDHAHNHEAPPLAAVSGKRGRE